MASAEVAMPDYETRSERSGVSAARSGRSGNSNGSRRYRTVSRGSNVDESLFGGDGVVPRGRKSSLGSTGRKIVKGQIPANATVLTMDDIRAIKMRSTIRSAAEEDEERRAREAENDLRNKAAKDRKARMLEMEAEAKLKAKKSDIEVEKMARDQMIKEIAEGKLDENNDLVKLMQSLGARAAAFTIRDRQMDEKKDQAKREKEYDDRMEALMELDRLKDIKRRDEEERRKVLKRREDRQVIIEQIQAREKAKVMELEAREQENKIMLATIKRYEEEDKKVAEKHAEEVAKSRQEVMDANEHFIQLKTLGKLREQEEVEAILAYQVKKDAEMRRREEEEQEKERMYKERQLKLLANQQKDMDKRAEVDEVRARRAAEEKERRERRRERTESEKRRLDIMQLQEDRKKQASMKKAQLAREAEQEEAEYEAALRYNSQMSKREKAEEERKHALNMQHREELQAQVLRGENRRKEERMAKFEEGRMLKQATAAEKARLEALRDKMCSDMEAKGFNPKYLTEVKSIDIHKLQMR